MALRNRVDLYQYRGNVLTSAPAVEPVTAAELRTLLGESATGLPDAEANDFIAQAREEIEELTGLALITQSWRLSIDRWPTAREPWWDGVREGSINDLHGPANMSSLRLPRYPLQSVTSVTVYDEDSNATTVTVASTFDIDTAQRPGRITLRSGATWPIATRANNAIEVVYVAGFGDTAAEVPAPLVRAVRQMAAYLYAHRGDECTVEDAYKASGAMTAAGRYQMARI